MTQPALQNIRVLDLTRILAGPYCTMMLADYGADVLKIEQPGSGDGTRQWGPPWVGDQAAYFLSANRNKKSMTLDLKTGEGLAILKKLAAEADVLIENFKVDTMQRMGLDYETLSQINPGLIYCSITGYGQNGPYRERPGFDFLIQAQGGVMSITGPADGEPYKVGVAVVDVTTGLFACNAILVALHHRSQTGRGQYIDVALLDSQVAWLINVAHNYFATGKTPQRYGNAHASIVPYETFPTADGHIAVGIGSDEQYRRLCRAIGRPDLADDPQYASNADRVTRRVALIGEMQKTFREEETAVWHDRILAAKIPVSPINDIPTILNDPQIAARQMVQEVEHPTAGPIKLLGPVAKLSETPATIRTAPPVLGADTDEILARLGYDVDAIAQLRANGVV
ncbi:MAG: CoA transferase [Anaerolineales bacterium]|nr:CoA transferase [Anaerolineales bacterium]